MSLTFKGSPGPTIGVEVEFQIVDRETRELTSLAPRILEAFPGKQWVKPELLQSTIEINTDICRNAAEVQKDLAEKIAQVRDVTEECNAALVGAGTHPLSHWRDQKITENERYYRLVDRVQWPAFRLLIFGLHVHVGVPDGETAIAVTNHLEQWLPHLLALSASSPFWARQDTGLASSRVKIFETLPTAGLPHRHESWEEFTRLMDALVKAQAIESIREIWWDIRPHPTFGTVEVRVCDVVPTLDEVVALAALVQALIVHVERQIAKGVALPMLHRRIVKENKWRAARWSTTGSTIVDEEGGLEPIAETIGKLLAELKPLFSELESERELPRLQQMLREGPSYARQRAVYRETGELEAVVDTLIREFEENRPFHI